MKTMTFTDTEVKTDIESEVNLKVLNNIYHQNEHNLSFFLTKINQISPSNSIQKDPTSHSPELKNRLLEKKPKFKYIFSEAQESPKFSKGSLKDQNQPNKRIRSQESGKGRVTMKLN